MSWNRTGSVSVTNGSPVVIGAGTAWVANARVSEAFKGPDGQLYEIQAINGDGQMTLASPYLGATAGGQSYVIVPTQGYIRDLAAQAAALINQFGDVVNGVGAGKFAPGANGLPSIRGVGDADTGINLPGTDVVQVFAGGANVLSLGGNGGVSGPAELFMPRLTIGINEFNFDNAGPGYRTYLPGSSGAINPPPFPNGFGHFLSFGSPLSQSGFQIAAPDGRGGMMKLRSRWNGNSWSPWTNLVEDTYGDFYVTRRVQAARFIAGYGTFAEVAVTVGDGGYGFWTEAGNLQMRVQGVTTKFGAAGTMEYAQNAFSYYPPNATYGGALIVGGQAGNNAGGINASKVQPTNSNLHIDSGTSGAPGDGAIYLNFYNGKNGTKFGDGNMTIVGEVRQDGTTYFSTMFGRIDAGNNLGSPALRWNAIYLASNPVVTSDGRMKLDQGASFGLDFICALQPKSYRIKDAKPIENENETFEEVEFPVMELVKVTKNEVRIVKGVPVLEAFEVEESRQIIDQIPVVDEKGRPVMVTTPAEYKTIPAVYEEVPAVLRADGSVLSAASMRMVSDERQELVADERQEQMTHPVPRTEKKKVARTASVVSGMQEGVRRHHGLLAQQVLSVLEGMGKTGADFAGLIRDEESDAWGLRYEQFIAPLIQAVQELREKVRVLEEAR